MPLFFFFWLQELQSLTKETKEHEISSSLQSPQTSPEKRWVCKNSKGFKITALFYQQVVVPDGFGRSGLQQVKMSMAGTNAKGEELSISGISVS